MFFVQNTFTKAYITDQDGLALDKKKAKKFNNEHSASAAIDRSHKEFGTMFPFEMVG